MSELSKTAASLRFFGETLDPDEVTRALGQPPSHSYRKGDVRALRDGGAWRERRGSWRRTVERRSPGDLDGQIGELLSGLTEDLEIWNALAKRYQADVFCGLFLSEGNEGMTISPATMQAIGARGLKLDLDIYGPECAEPPATSMEPPP